MAQIECGRGHLYDPDKYPACPYCNGNQKITVTAARHTTPIRAIDPRAAGYRREPDGSSVRSAGNRGEPDSAFKPPGDGSGENGSLIRHVRYRTPENHAPEGLWKRRICPVPWRNSGGR